VYDLIVRDATIVNSSGRLVADVAIQDGRIAYVGPRPPKQRTREEISAIGRFLIPGVIDTFVQFDPNGDPTIWERESRAAASGGITTVLAQPGGQVSVVDAASARRRLDRIGPASWTNYAMWGMATGDNAAALARARAASLIVGAWGTVGPNALPTSKVPAYIDHPGVLGLQLGALLDDPAALRATIDSIAGRTIHLAHLSSTEELTFLDPVHTQASVTASVTPHHLYFNDVDAASFNGAAPAPPPRPELDRRSLWAAVKRGRLDCLASDHHPCLEGSGGLPGAELLLPLLLAAAQNGRLSLEQLVEICAERPARVFGLERKGRIEKGFDADLVLFSEGRTDRVDPALLLSGAGWSPYSDREIAPKPEVVIIQGKVVARRGFIVGDQPSGRHALGAPAA